MPPSSRSIVHVDHERGWAGGQTQVRGLISYLHGRGHRITLVADPSGELGAWARSAGIAVHGLRIRVHFDPVAGMKLRRLLRRIQCDIVHFHTSRAHALSPWLSRRGSKLVVTRRMDYRLRGGWPVRWLYSRGVDGVVAISQGVKRALVESGVGGASIRVIPSGVDLERFRAGAAARAGTRRSLGVRNEEFLVLVPATLEPRKGHRFMLGALAQMRDSGHRLRVLCCGSGSLRRFLESMAARLELGEMVRFTGFAENLPELLAACDAVVLPSLQEGMGVALLEAMAASRPVVATAVGGIPEVLDQGAAGLLVPPADEQALAAAVGKLLADKGLAGALASAGRRRVERCFSLGAMARATEACYEELLGGDR